jgi:hypothetical protein
LKFINRSNFKLQSLVALAVIWLVGVSMLTYLLFFFDNNSSAKSLYISADFAQTVNLADNNAPISFKNNSGNLADAYVFINVNKKHMLTKFVSVVRKEELNVTSTNPWSSSVKKINRIIKPENTKKPADFSIKTAPEL